MSWWPCRLEAQESVAIWNPDPLRVRDEIKKAAVEHLIKHGYRGFRFEDIANRVGTTRANIHYHFGTKQKLVEEVVEEYVYVTLERHQTIFLAEELSLEAKIHRMMEFNHERYRKFNRRADRGRPWSLIARMRSEGDLLSERTKSALRYYVTGLNSCIRAAVEMAKRRGELSANAPVEDIATQLAGVANAAPAITQDAGSFKGLEQLYLGFIRILMQGYGPRPE